MTRLRVGGYLDGGGWRLLNADEEDFYNIHTMAMDKEHEEDDYFCWLAGWLADLGVIMEMILVSG